MRRKNSMLNMSRKKAFVGLLFVSPFIVGLLFFFFPTMINAVRFSVSQISMETAGYTLKHVGLQHFQTIFMNDPIYLRNLVNSMTTLLQNLLLVISVSFFFSILLNQAFKGRTVFRCIFFLPIVLTAGVMAVIEDPAAGSTAISSLNVANFLLALNLPAGLVVNVSSAISNMFVTINASGVQILVFLAALQTISPSLYEASHMEGATAWENFWKITFPMLSPYILTCTVYTVTDFAYQRQNVVMQQIMTRGMRGGGDDLSFSIAMALVVFLVTVALLTVVSVVISKVVFYYD